MLRRIGALLECDALTRVDCVLAVAAARGVPLGHEALAVTLDGNELAVSQIDDEHGGRLHVIERAGPGRLVIEYSAVIDGVAPPVALQPIDLVRYLRPSRYCESDRLGAVARAEFSGLAGVELIHAASSWVGTRVGYVSGSSRPTDGAVATLLAREGVCRDFAHLVVALLRACDVPARVVSVYAPGLSPMDFHAVAEVALDGRWLAVDATCLAPRSAMVRIATGRDAADTAFITNRGELVLRGLEVVATTDGDLPRDDTTALMSLQ